MTSVRTNVSRGGGISLLRKAVFAVAAFAFATTAIAAPPPDLASDSSLISHVRNAIEAEDFTAIDGIVNWQDVSDYKRRVFSAQIHHTLGRPIAKIELEDAGATTLKELQSLRNHRLNMPVTHLLRIKFADGAPGEIEPGAVFLVGKLHDAYRIALLVKAQGSTENE
ncbi:MAG: hypothetical protein ACRCS9_10130 [Hyphomicrobium sp.]